MVEEGYDCCLARIKLFVMVSVFAFDNGPKKIILLVTQTLIVLLLIDRWCQEKNFLRAKLFYVIVFSSLNYKMLLMIAISIPKSQLCPNIQR